MKLNKLQFKLVHKACDDTQEWIQERIWGRFAFVGFVTNGSIFPTQRLDGISPLAVGDYVKVNPKTTQFPFTVGNVTFENKWQIARYIYIKKDNIYSWELVDKKPPYYIFRDWVKSLRVSQDYGCTWENLGPITPNITASATIDSNYGTPEVNVLKQPKKEDDIDFNLHFDFHNLRGNGIKNVEVDHYENVVEEDEKVYTYTYCRITYTDDTELYPVIFKALKGDPALIDGQGAIEILSEEDELGIKFVENEAGIFSLDSNALRNAFGEEMTMLNTKIDYEITRATTKETELERAISDEVTRATTEEQRIEDKLDTEITNAKQAGHTFELTENDNDNVRSVTLTVKDRENNPLLNKTLNDFVLTGRTIAGHSLANDITAQNLQDAIKDLTATLTHKTISADDNTISDLVVGNFKNIALVKSTNTVRDYDTSVDTKLTTEKFLQKALQNIFTPTQDSHAANKKYVDDSIDALPEPMVFKGTVGTSGTITTLPTDGTASIGDTYKVTTAGTYAGKTAKIGDTFICNSKTTSANTWELIPSGDEPSGTVTEISAGDGITTGGSAITDTGTISVKLANDKGLGFDNGALQVLLDNGLEFHNGALKAKAGNGINVNSTGILVRTKNSGGIGIDLDGVFIDPNWLSQSITSSSTHNNAPTTKGVYDHVYTHSQLCATNNSYGHVWLSNGTESEQYLMNNADKLAASAWAVYFANAMLEQQLDESAESNNPTDNDKISYLERGSNKVNHTWTFAQIYNWIKGKYSQTINSSSTNDNAPTTKTVYDYIQNLINNNIIFGGTVTATAFYQSSDERLKDKVGDLELDKCKELLNIPAILYKLKSDETNKVQIGTIAQEVQKVMPELVQEDKEGMLSVAYDRLPMVCLELLKDAYKQIAELKQEVEQLKSK